MGKFRGLFLILFFVFSGILSRTPVSDFLRMVPEIHFSRPFIPTLTAAEIRTDWFQAKSWCRNVSGSHSGTVAFGL